MATALAIQPLLLNDDTVTCSSVPGAVAARYQPLANSSAVFSVMISDPFLWSYGKASELHIATVEAYFLCANHLLSQSTITLNFVIYSTHVGLLISGCRNVLISKVFTQLLFLSSDEGGILQRLPRPAAGPLPIAFLTISDLAYNPYDNDNLVSSFFEDINGTLHIDKSCSPGINSFSSIPSVAQWLGLEHNLCFCVPIPEEVLFSRNILRASLQFPNPPSVDNIDEANISSIASRVMRAMRFLSKLDTMIMGAELTGASLLCRASRSVSEDLIVRGAKVRLEIEEILSREVISDALIHSTGDRKIVTAAFDAYLPHLEETSSADGDLADFAIAVFKTARTESRVAVQAPRGIVQFIALYRNGGGFVEADVNVDHDSRITETALVLWEPNTHSPYSRWPAALQAAAKLR